MTTTASHASTAASAPLLPALASSDETAERMTATFAATLSQGGGETRLGARTAEMNESASLFFGSRLPNWPPQWFVIKVARRLLWPVMKRQVLFNVAMRDALLETRRAGESDGARAETLGERVVELEEKIETLTAQIQILTRRLAEEPVNRDGSGGGNGAA